jgi:hypothetical protein
MSLTDLPTLLTNGMLVTIAALLAVLVIVVVVVRGIRRWRSTRLELNDPPPLLIPVQRRGSTPPPLYPTRFGQERLGADMGQAGPGVGSIGIGTVADHIAGASHIVGVPTRNGHGPANAASALDAAPSVAAAPVKTPSGTASKIVHTIPPMDGTLQFLPGRLEIMDGESPGRDIRFVRTWGEIPEITFGRVSGPPYRHVQLRSQTVSRQHARMQYVDARWKMTNLSQTNPVVINGQALDPSHGNRVLRDGDQIEMGEVVFRFRER